MCYFCKSPVNVAQVSETMDLLSVVFSLSNMNPSIPNAISIRMIAKLSQSEDWHSTLDEFEAGNADHSRIEAHEETAYLQAVEFAKSFPDIDSTLINRDETFKTYGKLVRLMAQAQTPVDNPISAAFLSMSEILFKFPPELGKLPADTLEIQSTVEANVIAFNAQKELDANPYLLN